MKRPRYTEAASLLLIKSNQGLAYADDITILIRSRTDNKATQEKGGKGKSKDLEFKNKCVNRQKMDKVRRQEGTTIKFKEVK